MCRNCGAIVGAGQTQCSVCGADTVGSVASQSPRVFSDRETVRFARAILARPYKFTIIFLIANLFVFLLMWQSSDLRLSLMQVFPQEVLIAYGAKLNSLINSQRQWWRLITPMFVHVNLLHLMVNMYSLWILGPYVEKLYGSAKFTVFWVVTGIGASIASYLTVVEASRPLGQLGRFLFRPDLPSAGASGSLFGLVGVLFAFGIKFRRELPEGFKRAFGTGLLPMILLNLFIGYVGSGIFDNAAHLGGLVTGACLGSVVAYRRPGEKATLDVAWLVLQAAALALVIFSFVKVVQNFPSELRIASESNRLNQSPTPPVVQITGKAADFVVFSKAMNEAQDAFMEGARGNVKTVEPAINALASAPHLDPQADELKETLKTLLIDARTQFSMSGASPQKPVSEESVIELLNRFSAWKKRYEQWLTTMGKTHSELKD